MTPNVPLIDCAFSFLRCQIFQFNGIMIYTKVNDFVARSENQTIFIEFSTFSAHLVVTDNLSIYKL